jgi:hypothetical protein
MEHHGAEMTRPSSPASRAALSDVAILGRGAPAEALAGDLVARGLSVTDGSAAEAETGDGRYVVRFDPAEGDERRPEICVLRQGHLFLAGAAARQSIERDRLAFDDAANLGWKLALVTRDLAPDSLLDSYDAERRHAADEAPLNYRESPLTSEFAIDRKFRTGPAPGAELVDATNVFGAPGAERPGTGFQALFFTGDYPALPDGLATALRGFGDAPIPITTTVVTASAAAVSAGFRLVRDPDRALHRRLGAMTGAFYLIRPDRVVAARWQHPSANAIAAAMARATGHTGAEGRAARSTGW